MMLWKWYEGKFVKILDESPNVRRFFIDIGDEEFDFSPGQFITLDLPISDKRLKRWRSYSIANAPGEDLLELVVVRLEGGLGTEYLFDEVEVGDDVKFKGPSGTFVLPEEKDQKLVFICTGTGVAPFRSMIKYLEKVDLLHEREIHLIFGSRTKEDVLYKEEFCQLCKNSVNFKYTVALSREKNWVGPKGYVHQVYLDKYKNPREDIKFFLCGWTEMVDEAVENLILKLGYDKSQIIYELYG